MRLLWPENQKQKGQIMLFQLRTSNDLCGFKGLFLQKDGIRRKIAEVVNETEKFRRDLKPEVLQLCGWRESVSTRELENGIEIVSIDETVMPDYLTYFGQEIKLNFSNLRKFIKKKTEAQKNQEKKD